jgi:hypothetical protein
LQGLNKILIQEKNPTNGSDSTSDSCETETADDGPRGGTGNEPRAASGFKSFTFSFDSLKPVQPGNFHRKFSFEQLYKCSDSTGTFQHWKIKLEVSGAFYFVGKESRAICEDLSEVLLGMTLRPPDDTRENRSKRRINFPSANFSELPDCMKLKVVSSEN